MAQCKVSSVDFIKSAFTPQVAVICSPIAEQTCKKNNLTFIELLQPFSILNGDVHYKDPSGTIITIRSLKISLLEVSFRPPQPTLARKLLNSSVSDASEPKLHTQRVGEYTLDLPSSAPWFEAWRDTFLKVQFPSDHEFTKHFLACILVVSSGENNPVEALVQLAQSLNQLQSNTSAKLPKWFNSTVLRYYVIIHDNVEGNNSVAVNSFETIKTSYGVSNCFLLRMNSRPPGQTKEQLPDPWSQFLSNTIGLSDNIKTSTEISPNGACTNIDYEQEANVSENTMNFHPLSPDTEENPMNDANELSNYEKINILHGSCLSTDDVEQVKLLIHEFCTRALLPYVEKQVQQITEVVSNKKGVSRSLFSATKRWFTPNKPGSSSSTVNNLIYSSDSIELQMRKLGDIYFMFGHYSLAFQAYHSAKRDFNADQAWLYYAGALEMAALAAFMANESTRKTFDYMEESITTYLNTCKMAQFATRATLLSSECLKGRNLFGEAAHQLIRMTSEESDLRSAVLLEQAAYCFLQSTKPSMVRKYAFHMVLAGHRYSKAAQRKHSLRCYKQAFQVYQNRSWDLAEDHIHYTIGKQANNLNQLDEAIDSISKLLTGESKQTPTQQATFLKEYVTIHSMMVNTSGVCTLPLPILLNENIKMLVGPTAPLKTPGKVPAMGMTFINHEGPTFQTKWHKLEEILVQEIQGSLPLVFKPLITLYTMENLTISKPIGIVGEPIQVCVIMHNPLHITLNLKDIYLLWYFNNDNNFITNEEIDNKKVTNYMKTNVMKSCIIQANCQQELILSVIPLMVGELCMKGISYKLIYSSSSEDPIIANGKQLFDIKLNKKISNKSDVIKDKKHLEISIVPSAPCLQVTFSELPNELLCNEIRKVTIDLRNVGTIPLHNVYISTSVPHLVSCCEFQNDKTNVHETADTTFQREKLAKRNHITYVPLINNKLDPGQCHSINIWIKAPDVKGPAAIDLLIYYESIDPKSIPRYRLVKHMWQLSIQESLKIDVAFRPSYNSKTVQQLALIVKMTNLNNVHHATTTKISLLKVAFLSKYWILSDDVLSPKIVDLKSQETAHIILKAKRKLPKQNNYSEVKFFSNKRKQLYNIDDKVSVDFAEKCEYFNYNIFDDPEFNEKENAEAAVVLQWQGFTTETNNEITINGQFHIPFYKFTEFNDDDTPPSTEYEESFNLFDNKTPLHLDILNKNDDITSLQTLITYNLLHPPQLCHNFQKNKLCVTPIKLLLHNSSDSNTLLVTVNTLGTSSLSPPPSNRPNIFYPYASKHFRWIGPSGQKHILKPLSSKCIRLTIALLSPGTYDIGARIEIWCQNNDQNEQPILQTCRIQSALIVISDDN